MTGWVIKAPDRPDHPHCALGYLLGLLDGGTIPFIRM
jgi:hypothetical protein